MPMESLNKTRIIAPIAQLGVVQRAQALSRSGGQPGDQLLLVAMGGIDYRLPMEEWPTLPGVRWLVPQAWGVRRDDVSALETMGMSFSDLLASCDVVLTKPGYGMFAEAAYAGVPVLYVSRGEWPEQPYLVEWLKQHGVCLEVTQEALDQGDLRKTLQRAGAARRAPVSLGSGVHEAADILQSILMRTTQ